MTDVHSLAQALLDPKCPVPADVRARAGIDPVERFAVHRNNIMVSLVDALADAYPVTESLLGTFCFRATAREYVQQSWPTSPVLADYGADFGVFLSGFAPLQSIGYLPDLATLEWARQRSLHAQDGVALLPESLAAVWSDAALLEGVTWTLHPAAHVILSPHPVVSIWAAHQHRDASAIHTALSEIVHQPEAALVVRDAWTVGVVPIDPGQAVFLRALQAGKTMPVALSEALEEGHPVPVVDTLTLLINHRVFTDFQAESPR